MGGSTPAVQPYQAAPREEDPAVQEAIRKERELALKRKGRQSTILTSASGLSNASGLSGLSDTGKKTLLG